MSPDDENVKVAARNIQSGLYLIGIDTYNKEDTQETAERWVKALLEFNQGPPDVAAIMKGGFIPASHPGMVVQSGIPFRALCEHHLFPMHGTAHVGYIPEERMTGLSKLVRIVDAFGTARPGTQEIITEEIGRAINMHLAPKGVGVVIEAAHTCIDTRGVHATGVMTRTSFMHGVFLTEASCRDEFLRLT